MNRILAAAVGILLFVGCSGAPDDQPELTEVTGLVTLDGKPVEWASVTFNPVDGRRGASGATDIEGNFQLSYSKSMGCPLGDHTVEISTRREIQDEYGGTVGMEPETIPGRYNNQTELTANVSSGGENHFVFSLESEKK